jgi:hypothetical protein
MTHRNQHFVPKSLLKGWMTEGSHHLVEFHWSATRLKSKDVGPKSTGYLRDGYSVNLCSKELKLERWETYVETEFFTKKIDNPVGPVLASIRGHKSFEQLTAEDRDLWATFMIAQWVRTPQKVTEFADAAAFQYLIEQAERLEQEAVPTTDEAKMARAFNAQAILDSHIQIGRNNAVQALPSIISSHKLVQTVRRALWSVIDLRKSRIKLVLSDHPVYLEGSLRDDFLMFLPLGPRLLFVAASTSELLRFVGKKPQTDLARQLNKESVLNAQKYVFASDRESEALVRRRLPHSKFYRSS